MNRGLVDTVTGILLDADLTTTTPPGILAEQILHEIAYAAIAHAHHHGDDYVAVGVIRAARWILGDAGAA